MNNINYYKKYLKYKNKYFNLLDNKTGGSNISALDMGPYTDVLGMESNIGALEISRSQECNITNFEEMLQSLVGIIMSNLDLNTINTGYFISYGRYYVAKLITNDQMYKIYCALKYLVHTNNISTFTNIYNIYNKYNKTKRYTNYDFHVYIQNKPDVLLQNDIKVSKIQNGQFILTYQDGSSILIPDITYT